MERKRKVKSFKKTKNLIILGLIISVVAVAVTLFFILAPKIGSEPISFDIEDKCGPFMGSVLHPLQDQGMCEVRCRGQCESLERTIDHVEFTNREPNCHLCKCYCK